MSLAGIPLDAYCVKCKSKKLMIEVKKVEYKSGKIALKGECVQCGTGMYRLLKKEFYNKEFYNAPLKCPFCGIDPDVIEVCGGFMIKCRTICCVSPFTLIKTKKSVIKRWNTRV